jgi:hypothetical protein
MGWPRHACTLLPTPWKATTDPIPDGRALTADLPGHVKGHYGGDLRRLIVPLYHRWQITIPRITTQLRDLGVDIDRRQVRRLLDDTDAKDFLTESQDLLHAGLATASWVSGDDTGARHQAGNGYCTQIGDDRFTAFLTRFSKPENRAVMRARRRLPLHRRRGCAGSHGDRALPPAPQRPHGGGVPARSEDVP